VAEPLDNDCNPHQKLEVVSHSLKEHFRNHEEVLVLEYFAEYTTHMTSNHAFANEHMVEEKALFDTSNFPSGLGQL
jgi:hypothetical protein